MAYEPYATPDYYRQEYCGKIVPEDELEKALRQASRHIDSLTYNRIAGRGFSNLTSFQQELIRDVVCQQADFETENAMTSVPFFRATASMAYPCSLAIPGMFLQTREWQ